jgi:hypothetical protein
MIQRAVPNLFLAVSDPKCELDNDFMLARPLQNTSAVAFCQQAGSDVDNNSGQPLVPMLFFG